MLRAGTNLKVSPLVASDCAKKALHTICFLPYHTLLPDTHQKAMPMFAWEYKDRIISGLKVKN